ncbi:MAG: hypothetical protein K0R50_4271 [Eubacterium sp.]|nr:hypothetical protein [Eubacterium sp.]
MGILIITVMITLHILADFYLQTEKIARNKVLSFKGVSVHSLQYGIVYALAFIFVRFNPLLLLCFILAVIAHFLVDSLKYWMSNRSEFKGFFGKPALIFLADQLLHIVSLLLIVLLYEKAGPQEPLLYLYGIWSELLGVLNLKPAFAISWLLLILLILKPANITFGVFFSTFKPEEEAKRDEKQQKTGAIIGSLERILIVFFISINQYSALGFILTAKSIARYDAIAKDRMFAEYYLIGTLVSVVFSVAAYTLVF